MDIRKQSQQKSINIIDVDFKLNSILILKLLVFLTINKYQTHSF